MKGLRNLLYDYSMWTRILVGLAVIFIGVIAVDIGTPSPSENPANLPGLYGSLFFLELIPVALFIFGVWLTSLYGRRIRQYLRQELRRNPEFRLSLLNIPRGKFFPAMASLIVAVWALGWCLYVAALWSNYRADGNFAEILGYAAVSALDMFMLDINGNVLDNINSSGILSSPGILKGGIALTAILASLCTFSVLLNLFFSRASTFLHSRAVRASENHDHLYVFWGTGEKERTLAESIMKNDPRHIVVMVEPPAKDEEQNHGVERILSYFTRRNPVVDEINRRSHALLLSADEDVHSLADEAATYGFREFWDRLGLEKIASLAAEVRNFAPKSGDSERRLHFFFLSDNREENLRNTTALASLLRHSHGMGRLNPTVYCAGRKTGVASVIEERDFGHNDSASCPPSPVKINIVDDARLSVEVLKRDEDNGPDKKYSHPVHYVDLDLQDNPGTAKTPFTALMLGFGETGRDVLKFIYEFGAFVGGDRHRSPFQAHVVDRDIASLATIFRENRPGVDTEDNIEANGGKPLVSYHGLDAGQPRFYNLLRSIIGKLNYVVVALGDDELNMEIATRLLKFARRNRSDLSRFRIFVRTYNRDSFSQLEPVAEFYNSRVSEETGTERTIVLFGKLQEIYDYNIIVKNRFTAEAANYAETYQRYSSRLTSGEKGNSGAPANTVEPSRWEKADRQAINDFQNRQNAVHADTKLHIIESFLKANLPEYDRDNGPWERLAAGFDIRPETMAHRRVLHPERVEYPDAGRIHPDFDKLLSNLARMEHLRWNASFEMMGFRRGPVKDYRTMEHPALRPWDELPLISDTDITRVYDYLVTETSLLLKKSTNQKQ